jgi:hypothetical protein
MKERPPIYAAQLQIYWIGIRGQPTRGGLPALGGLGEVLTTPYLKKRILLRIVYKNLRAWTDTLAQERDRWRALVR